MSSNVFTHVFNFHSWPQVHSNDVEMLRGYNGCFFDLRYSYRRIFPEDEFQDIEFNKQLDKTKIQKIQYSVNLLCKIGQFVNKNGEIENDGVKLMELMSESDELCMFTTTSIQNLIQYRWQEYGSQHYTMGMIMHVFYTAILVIYVIEFYLPDLGDTDKEWGPILLILGIVYPLYYEIFQLCKQGVTSYFSDLQNYSDIVYIWGSVANFFLQHIYGPYHIVCKLLMIVIILQVLLKTFSFMRIFESLAPIVVLMQNVFYDLRIFMLFYVILLAIFCQAFAVLGLGADYQQLYGIGEEKRMLKAKSKASGGASKGTDIDGDQQENVFMEEYQAIGLHLAEFVWTFRLSMGDNALIEASRGLPKAEGNIFWILWIIGVIITSIVFLNFIVAEASSSYAIVTKTLEKIIW